MNQEGALAAGASSRSERRKGSFRSLVERKQRTDESLRREQDIIDKEERDLMLMGEMERQRKERMNKNPSPPRKRRNPGNVLEWRPSSKAEGGKRKVSDEPHIYVPNRRRSGKENSGNINSRKRPRNGNGSKEQASQNNTASDQRIWTSPNTNGDMNYKLASNRRRHSDGDTYSSMQANEGDYQSQERRKSYGDVCEEKECGFDFTGPSLSFSSPSPQTKKRILMAATVSLQEPTRQQFQMFRDRTRERVRERRRFSGEMDSRRRENVGEQAEFDKSVEVAATGGDENNSAIQEECQSTSDKTERNNHHQLSEDPLIQSQESKSTQQPLEYSCDPYEKTRSVPSRASVPETYPDAPSVALLPESQKRKDNKKQASSDSKRIEDLKRLVENLTCALDRLKDEKKSLKDQVEVLTSSNQAISNRLDEVKLELARSKEEARAKEDACKKPQNESLRNQDVETQALLFEKQQEVSRLEDEKQSLQDEVDYLKSNNQESTERLEKFAKYNQIYSERLAKFADEARAKETEHSESRLSLQQTIVTKERLCQKHKEELERARSLARETEEANAIEISQMKSKLKAYRKDQEQRSQQHKKEALAYRKAQEELSRKHEEEMEQARGQAYEKARREIAKRHEEELKRIRAEAYHEGQDQLSKQHEEELKEAHEHAYGKVREELIHEHREELKRARAQATAAVTAASTVAATASAPTESDATAQRWKHKFERKAKEHTQLQQNFNTIAMQSAKQSSTIDEQREEIRRLRETLSIGGSTMPLKIED